MRCAVIGSTGYVGVRLVPRLLREGHEVGVLVRTQAKLASTGWSDAVDVVPGDLADPEALAALLVDADVVVHLAHALDRSDFPERDRAAARAVRDAAVAAEVSRIVYLGGLRPTSGEPVSRHLASRAEVADVFLDSAVPTVALEASIIVGSGSASFEMIRYLAERVPLVPAVPWVAHRTQPVAIDDVLHYLVAAVALPAEVDRRFDVGGPDVLTYLEILRRYLRVAGLSQSVAVPLPIPVPPGAPALAAWVVDALTPLSRHLVAPLIESLAHDLVCAEQDVLTVLGAPPRGRTTYDRAVRAALGRRPDGTDPEEISPVSGTRHPLPACSHDAAAGDRSGADDRSAALAAATDPDGSGGQVVRWSTVVPCAASPERLWAAVCALGGDSGWHTVPGVAAVGRWADQLLGGAGAYRGRPHGRDLEVGDVLDGFRVEALDPGRLLRLRGETRVPGRLWLAFAVTPRAPGDGIRDSAPRGERSPIPGGGSVLHTEVVFAAAGLGGWAYGTAVRVGAPLVVGAMAAGVVRDAERSAVGPVERDAERTGAAGVGEATG